MNTRAMVMAIGLALVGCAADDAGAEEVDTTSAAYSTDLDPGLVFTSSWAQIWKPGNPQNIAPGYYVHFGFQNDSNVDIGGFTIDVRDAAGLVVKQEVVPSLPAHASSEIVVVAPYACGWSRTATLSANHRTRTFSHMCPIIKL